MAISNFNLVNEGYGIWKVQIEYKGYNRGMVAEAKHILDWLEDIANASRSQRIPFEIGSFANYAYGFIKKEEKL